MIRGFPNGTTYLSNNDRCSAIEVLRQRAPGELKHLSNLRKRKQYNALLRKAKVKMQKSKCKIIVSRLKVGKAIIYSCREATHKF